MGERPKKTILQAKNTTIAWPGNSSRYIKRKVPDIGISYLKPRVFVEKLLNQVLIEF